MRRLIFWITLASLGPTSARAADELFLKCSITERQMLDEASPQAYSQIVFFRIRENTLQVDRHLGGSMENVGVDDEGYRWNAGKATFQIGRNGSYWAQNAAGNTFWGSCSEATGFPTDILTFHCRWSGVQQGAQTAWDEYRADKELDLVLSFEDRLAQHSDYRAYVNVERVEEQRFRWGDDKMAWDLRRDPIEGDYEMIVETDLDYRYLANCLPS